MSSVGVAVLIGLSETGRVQAGFRNKATCYPPCVTPCGPTELKAGDASDDLKVHIVGAQFDTVDVFFREELFYRETFSGGGNLHCGPNVVLAPKNPYGTFAVRFGPHGDTVKVYGWKKNEEKPVAKQVTLDPGHPVRLQWVTARILKVEYGPNYEKEYVLRFTDAEEPWRVLYPGP